MQPESPAHYITHDERIRRHYLLHEIRLLNAMADDDIGRVRQGHHVLSLSAGMPFILVMEGGGEHEVPQLVGTSSEFMAEMFDASMMAVIGMAGCLSARYMEWPVEIRGQVVPGTGREPPEVLRDWVMKVPSGYGG